MRPISAETEGERERECVLDGNGWPSVPCLKGGRKVSETGEQDGSTDRSGEQVKSGDLS